MTVRRMTRGLILSSSKLIVAIWISACGQRASAPVAVTPESNASIGRDDAPSLIFQANQNAVTVEDVALSAALLNLPASSRDIETVAAAATRMLRSDRTVDPNSLNPIPTLASADFAQPEGILDVADIAVMFAGERTSGTTEAAIASFATALLGDARTLAASDINAVPGMRLPGDLGQAGGKALVVRDDAGVVLSSQIADEIDRLPSSTPRGGNVFLPPGTELSFPSPPDPERALRVSFRPRL
ncbi:MAG: hypothetical protein AAFY15_16940, partial [Cyanobacteria bacterium J06648_11]